MGSPRAGLHSLQRLQSRIGFLTFSGSRSRVPCVPCVPWFLHLPSKSAWWRLASVSYFLLLCQSSRCLPLKGALGMALRAHLGSSPQVKTPNSIIAAGPFAIKGSHGFQGLGPACPGGMDPVTHVTLREVVEPGFSPSAVRFWSLPALSPALPEATGSDAERNPCHF